MATKKTSEKSVSVASFGKTHSSMLLNILGYREEGEWVALALEMDLRGYGETFEEAIEDLRELVFMQISFAHFKNQPEMILRPADPVWFSRFAETRQDLLSHMLEPRSLESAEYLSAGLEIPPPHVIAEISKGFASADA